MGQRSLLNRALGIALACLSAPCVLEAGTPNLQRIQKTVAEREVGSVEELLPYLSTVLRSRYALVFESRSLQGSSYREPRALLYGLDAKFVVAFNGGAAQRGFDAVEMMEFDESDKVFYFQEVEFQRSPNDSRRAIFSVMNPAKCTACHGKVPRPIWDTRPMWPGVYGEIYRERPSAQEEEGFASFLRDQPSHSRYKHLRAVDRFETRFRYQPSAEDRYARAQVEAPNAELSNLLSDLNLQSIAAAVLRHESFDLYKYALLAALTPSCEDIGEFFPGGLAPVIRESFAAFSARSDLLNQQQQERKRARLQQDPVRFGFASRASVGDRDSLRRFRFVVEIGLGLTTDGWSLAFEKETYDFTTSHTATEQLERGVLGVLALREPALVRRHWYGSQTDSPKYCSYLANRSRETLERAQTTGVPIRSSISVVPR